MPEGERALLEQPGAFAPAGNALRAAYTPDVLSRGGETVDLAGIAFEVLAVPGHSPAHLAYHADGCLFSGDVLFAGSVGRTDLPGADWDTLLASIRTLVDTLPADTVVYPGHGPTTTLGRRARAQPVPRGAPRGADCVSERVEDRAPARHARRLPTEQPLWRRVTARSSASARCTATGRSRRRSSRTPRSSSGRPAPARTSCRRRCTRSPTARTARSHCARGDRADLPRLRRARDAPRAAAGEALHDRVDVPLRRAQQGRYREHWQASVEAVGSDDPSRSTPSSSSSTTRCSAGSASPRYHLELNSIGCRECRPAYLERCARGSTPTSTARRGDAREGGNEPAPRLRQLRGEAGGGPARARRRPEDRRVAVRRVRRALRGRPRRPRRPGSEYGLVPTLVRGLDYYSRTTWEFIGRSRTRTRRSRAAAATTTSSRRSAGRRRRASASARGSSGLLLAMEEEGVGTPRRRRSTSSSPSRRLPRTRVVAVGSPSSARRGVSATRTTPAGRSRASSRRRGDWAPRPTVVVAPAARRFAEPGARTRPCPRRAPRQNCPGELA